MVCVHSSVVTLDPRPLVVTSSSSIPKMNKSTGNQTWFAGNFTIYIYILIILIIVDVPSYKPCNTSVFGGGVFHNFPWLSHIFHSHISFDKPMFIDENPTFPAMFATFSQCSSGIFQPATCSFPSRSGPPLASMSAPAPNSSDGAPRSS